MTKQNSKKISHEIKDVLYLVALRGLNYIAPLLVFPYLMKVLGAEKFGYIGFSLSVMMYLMLIVDFGFNLSATKRIALAKDNQNELNNIFTATLYAKVVLLAISLLVLLVFAAVPRFEIYRKTMFIMFPMVVGNAFTFVWLFQGLGQIRFISIFNVISKLSILPLTFIFVKTADDYLIGAFLQSFVVVFTMLISIVYIVKKRWVSISAFIKKNVVFELKDSFPIFLSSAAISIYMASFVIALGYFSTSEEVGQYSAVDKIMRAFCMLVWAPVSQAFYPKITRMGAENKAKAIKLVRKLLLLVCVCMFIVLLAMFFLSPYLVDFLGKDYQNSLHLFRIMAFAPIFIGCGGVVAQLGILALGDTIDKRNYQRVYLIAGIVALCCIFVGIPLFGATGAAVSLLLTEIVVCIMMLLYGRKFL
ncbi:MAG: flippase [Bacteroidales bacterium]|jgi:O-antigen/teichoic acid export membrane protein|nr:flippase [Bacteroidales bacterium]